MKYLSCFIFLTFVSMQSVSEHKVQATWSMPTHRENGELLSTDEIGGYRLYYECGEAKTIVIDNGTVQSLQINDLPDGTCHFKIAAFDRDGILGVYSDTVTQVFGSKPNAPIQLGISTVSKIPPIKLDCEVDVNCSVHTDQPDDE